MEFGKAVKARTQTSVDEWYTPASAVYPIIPYIKPVECGNGLMREPVVWCPFDKPESEYFKVLSKQFQTVATHIETGNDFFDTNIEECDYIISNPPFSLRMTVFERLFKLGKPWAMLFNYTGLWDSKKRYELFKEYGIELLILKGRTLFIRPEGKSGVPMFQSIYVCHNMLPEKIMYE